MSSHRPKYKHSHSQSPSLPGPSSPLANRKLRPKNQLWPDDPLSTPTKFVTRSAHRIASVKAREKIASHYAPGASLDSQTNSQQWLISKFSNVDNVSVAGAVESADGHAPSAMGDMKYLEEKPSDQLEKSSHRIPSYAPPNSVEDHIRDISLSTTENISGEMEFVGRSQMSRYGPQARRVTDDGYITLEILYNRVVAERDQAIARAVQAEKELSLKEAELAEMKEFVVSLGRQLLDGPNFVKSR